MFQVIHHLTAHPTLFINVGLLSWFQGSSLLAYVATGTVVLVTGIWFARLHLSLLTENRRLNSLLSEADAKGQATRDATLATHEFLTRITHEMRTPMNGIVSFAALALKTDLTDLQREYLDRVLTSAEWLTHVVSDVLDFARMESSRLELEAKSFSFANCVLSAVKMVEPAAHQKHLELAYRVDPRIPAVLNGDPNRLRQILVNLLENAIRYTTTGSVVLSAGAAAETAETFTLSITVADTGNGIRPEDQARIFLPFQTALHHNDENRTGGTGLGLSICKRLVEAMGGSMEVQSQIGAGSTFRFTAVVKKLFTEADNAESADVLSKLGLKRLAILLADENVLSRRLTTKLLESVGHQISPAATAGEALILFTTEIFDLVLLSTDLPDMRGLALARSLRKLEDDAMHTQFYVLRAEDHDTDASAYLAAGIDGIVSKPVQVEQLLRIVNQACSAKAALEHHR